MNLVWVASAIVTASIVFAMYYAFVKAELFRLSRYEYWADRFYAAAKPLVANSETPPTIISLIESFNRLITKNVAPLGIASVFRQKIEVPDGSESFVDEQFAPFFEKFPDLFHNAMVASRAGLMAASYVHWAGGAQARAILADTFADMELRRHEISIAADVKKVEKINRSPSLVPLFVRRA